jgi:succinate dehydrogenase / fumarate reductase, cytochrome b subunit
MTSPLTQSSSSFVSTIWQKAIVATSGLVLIAFTIFHLLGNLLLLGGGSQSFNLYADRLHQWPWFHGLLEIILALAFGIHIYYGITIGIRNRQAKPQTYLAMPWWRKVADRSALITGPLLLLFILIHLQNFRLGGIPTHSIIVDRRSIEDWEGAIAETFQQPIYLIFYVVMTIPLGFHVRHGLYSAVQSLGLAVDSGEIWKKLSWAGAIGIALGFALIPLWFWLSRAALIIANCCSWL